MSQLHPGLASYLGASDAEQGVWQADGSVFLTFDGQYRVAFLPGANGALLLEARVIILPDAVQARQLVLELLLENAAGTLAQRTASLTLARDRQTLMLQQRLPAEAVGQDFERILENFINTLAGFRGVAGVL